MTGGWPNQAWRHSCPSTSASADRSKLCRLSACQLDDLILNAGLLK
jgi:hypothetical protein